MKKNIFLILILYITGLTACEEWFDVRTDNTLVDEETLYKNDNAFLNALTDVYTQLRAPSLYGEQLSFTMDFLAQNFVPDTEKLLRIANYEYEHVLVKPLIRNIWKEMYRAIASCNKILEHIEETDISFYYANQKEMITGELYALRASLHFELLRMFHPHPAVNATFTGMPYMTAFGSKVGDALSTKELLTLITEDLEKAENLLYSIDPLFNTSQTYSTEPGKFNRRLRTFHLNYYAVTAMLARVNLYQGKYAEAYNYADTTFNHLRRVGTSAQIFYYFGAGKYGSDKSFSREHIFGIASPPEGFTALSEALFTQRKIFARADFREVYPLVKDTRYRDWFVLAGGGSENYIMEPKFSRESLLEGYTSTSGNERILPVRIPFIKLGEVALIAAEALNESGKTTEAAAWIIELQNYRDIKIVQDLLNAGNLTQDRLREEIRAEYQREFYGEGQLFFFHKRQNDTQLKRYNGEHFTINTASYTFPIPADGLSVVN